MKTLMKSLNLKIYQLRYDFNVNPSKHKKIDIFDTRHRKYLGKKRPVSWIIMSNPKYFYIEENCMHFVLDVLFDGALISNNKKFHLLLKELIGKHNIPNDAFKEMCYGKYIIW